MKEGCAQGESSRPEQSSMAGGCQSPSRPPEVSGKPRPLAFRKVTIQFQKRKKLGGELAERKGRGMWGIRVREEGGTKADMDPLEASRSQLSIVVGDI